MSSSIYNSLLSEADSLLRKNSGKLGGLRVARDAFARIYHPATTNFSRGPSPDIKKAAVKLLEQVLAVAPA